MDEEAGGSLPAADQKRDDGKPAASSPSTEPKPAASSKNDALEHTDAQRLDLLKRELLESKRSWRLVWMLVCFTTAYIFIIWASLYSPPMLLLSLVLLPFLPFRWWEAVILLLSVVLIFSVCRWDDVHTGMRLYHDAHEGHWI